MAVATMTRLPRAQWQLLNLLYRRGLYTADRQVRRMLQYADAGVADLLALEDAELVQVRHNGRACDLNHRTCSLDGEATSVAVTAAGGQWVCGNPANCAVYAIWLRGSGHPVALRRVLAAEHVDADTVAGVVEDGLAAVTDVRGEDLDARAVTNRHRNPDWVLLRLTPRGHRVMNGG